MPDDYKHLLQKIADCLKVISFCDLSTAERQIVELLAHSGFVSLVRYEDGEDEIRQSAFDDQADLLDHAGDRAD